jgi:hypothetical protein
MRSKRRQPRSKIERAELFARSNPGWTTNRESLAALLNWFLPDDEPIFAKLEMHGNTKWVAKHLVTLALCWAWSESRNLTDAWIEAIGCCGKMLRVVPLKSYQGFMKAIASWTSPFLMLLFPLLHRRMEEIGGTFWRIGGWVPIAFDGSRSTAPRSQVNESAFCAPNYGKGTRARYGKKKSKGLRRKRNQRVKRQPQEPQAWITLMWHMGLRLPWMWRLGPSHSSERAHVSEMLKEGVFPKNTLFCGDAGFTGYPLWSEILQQGAHFLVRVGSNVNLLKESARYSQRKNIVLCWPKAMMKGNRSPLRLRLVKVRLGKTSVWLLTSVLSCTRLPLEHIIKLYKIRWGIEIEFRGLKHTLDRAKLRSRNSQRLLAELHWSIMAMTVAELFALKEQLGKKASQSMKDGSPPDPTKRSLANTMRALRHCLRHLDEVPAAQKDLRTLLRMAKTDSYRRKASKGARYRPPNPDKKPLGIPKLRTLTADEKKKLRELARQLAA